MTAVRLFGKDSERTVEVTPRDFPTWHVKTRLNPVDATPLTLTPNPVIEADNPLGDRLKSLIADCDAVLKPNRHPAAQAQLDRCVDYLNERAEERNRYERHNNVPEKRERAMKRLSEIQRDGVEEMS